MELSRRSFLGGALVLAVATQLPGAALARSEVPWLWGDGMHDDTAGLQAMLDGKPVYVVKDREVITAAEGQPISFSGGQYRISETIVFRRRAFVRDLALEPMPDWQGDHVLEVEDGHYVHIDHLHLQRFSTQTAIRGGPI